MNIVDRLSKKEVPPLVRGRVYKLVPNTGRAEVISDAGVKISVKVDPGVTLGDTLVVANQNTAPYMIRVIPRATPNQSSIVNIS